ncbi:hypothetical protein ACFQ2B_06040 [Streptomyces stramineus]
MTMCRDDDQWFFGRWRRRVLHSLPGAVRPLRDLVPGARAPRFLDIVSDSVSEGLETVRATPPALVRSEIERVYADHPGPAPLWVRGLYEGDAGAWHVMRRAQRAAFDSVLGPVWPLVQDLHQGSSCAMPSSSPSTASPRPSPPPSPAAGCGETSGSSRGPTRWRSSWTAAA